MDMPAVIGDWLRDHSIALDPDPNQRDGIWAEWDSRRGQLHMGWWESYECPRCNQTDRPVRYLVVAPGFDDNNWQHGCGHWWHPVREYITVTATDTDEGIQSDLDTLLAAMRQEQQEAATEIRVGLVDDLRNFLDEHQTEGDRQGAAYGSQTEPGVWRPAGGEWEAWEYDPRSVGDTITVTESDLEPVKVDGTHNDNGRPGEGLVIDWEEHNALMDGTDGIDEGFDGREVVVPVRLSPALASRLVTARMGSIVQDEEHAGRFEVGSPGLDVMDERWGGGSMSWCATAADAILLLSYEKACGFEAGLLMDLEYPDPYVVLTARPFEF